MRQVAAAGGRVVVAETLEPGTDRVATLIAPDFKLPVAWDEVDAVVSIALASAGGYLERAQAEGKAVVLASHFLADFDGPIAQPDNFGGVRNAVEHLIAHGHTRIGFVGSTDQHDYRERHTAYMATMTEHGLPCGDDLFFAATSYAQSGGTAAAAAYLASTDRPTALMCATDQNALGVLEAVTGAGVSVPGDLAIIGFDDEEESAFAVPSLTSVGQRFDDVGALAGRMALAIVAGEEVASGAHTADAAFLAARASCGCRTDLVDDHPDREPRPVPIPRDELRAGVSAILLTMLGESPDTCAGASVTRAIDLLDQMLADPTEPGWDVVHAFVRELSDLTPGTEMLQQVAAVLNGYAHRVATGDARRVGATRAVATLWELEARGYLHRSRRLDASVVELDTVAGGLVRASGARTRSLAWLGGTHVRAGILALWHARAGGGLRVEGIHDPGGILDVAVGSDTQVRCFPPTAMMDAADGAVGEICIVVPVASAEQELGLLALIGRIDTTSARETYHHWAEMLCWALEGELLQNAVRASEERYAFASRAANDGLWERDVASGATYLSQRCRDLLGVEPDVDGSGGSLIDGVHPEDRQKLGDALAYAEANAELPVEVEYRRPLPDGSVRWLLTRVLGVAPDGGAVQRLVGSVSDIDQRKTLEEQLRQAALFDAVTGLPNRRLFLDRLSVAMEYPRRRKSVRFAVLFLDLDGFKLVNDSLGHLMGDELLRIVGERLREDLRSVDTAARFGGDEFALLLTDPVPDDLLVVARRIQDRISAPVLLGEQEVSVTASIGIAASETPYAGAEDVLRDADIAMYQAKESERGTACLFDPKMHERALDRLRTRSALTAALEAHQFVVHYQPIVDLDGADVTQFEALVRWNHPERGLLLPKDFLPAMEGNATIIALGHQVIEDVCAQIAAWRADHRTVTVSVNLSHREFWDPELLPTIRSILELHSVPPECLIIEITESVIMTDPTEARTIMEALHKVGLRLHIDDFGTGHSSLNVLRTFPVDALKIDGSFVRELALVDQTTALVRTIVAMGQVLGIDVVAECVETHEQADELRAMGCTTAQGWLYAKALPADDAGDILGTRLIEHEPAVPSEAGGPSLSR